MKAIDFVIDLLKFDSPELFAVRLTEHGEKSEDDEAAVHVFIQHVQNFISQNQLKHKLLHHMNELLVRNVHDYYTPSRGAT